jgi:hypothetical protein
MKSVISYPDRGPYGKSNYRGNTSGYVIKEMLEHFQPKLFVDVCEGSGTSRDVAKEMNIEYVGLDLHRGFDFTTASVLKAIPRPADLVFSHPPYHNMIDYTVERKKHKLGGSGNDISRCATVDEFIELATLMLNNQREATRPGGIYATLIGDMRKNGKFHSFQADLIKMMPASELKSVVIKMQHNTMSDSQTYRGNFIPIHHEYLILFERQIITFAQVAWEKAKQLQSNMNSTWRNFVKLALMELGGEATMDKIYAKVEAIAGEKVAANKNYQAKIRQTLQLHFENIDRGRWKLAA